METIKVKIEMLESSFGMALYVNEHRVAGAKPLGGGKVVKTWTLDADTVLQQIPEAHRAEMFDFAEWTSLNSWTAYDDHTWKKQIGLYDFDAEPVYLSTEEIYKQFRKERAK